jgi:hypothetical protein
MRGFWRSAWVGEEVFYGCGGSESPMVARDYRACITAYFCLLAGSLMTRAQHAISPDPLAQPALDPHYYEDEFGQCFLGLRYV